MDQILGVGLEGVARPDPTPRIVGLELPANDVVAQVDLEDLIEPLAMAWMLDRDEDLHATVEVARHQVGRPDEVERLVIAAPVIEPSPPITAMPTTWSESLSRKWASL